MAKKDSNVQKGKKKKWFSIIAPKVFNETVLGETPAYESSSLVGKTVRTSMMNVIRDIKKQNINVRLKISEVRDNKAYTTIDSYEMNHSSIRRMVRRKKDRVDDSFVVLTKDEIKVRVKPMVLTRQNTNQPVLSGIRLFVRSYLIEKIQTLTYNEFVNLVITDRIVREMKKPISLVYPIRMMSMRSFRIVEGDKIKLTTSTQKSTEILAAIKDKLANRAQAREKAYAEREAKRVENKSEEAPKTEENK